MITVIVEAVLREWITHTRRKGQAVRLWLIYRLQVGLILAALKIPVRVLCPCAALGHGVPRPRTSTASTASTSATNLAGNPTSSSSSSSSSTSSCRPRYRTNSAIALDCERSVGTVFQLPNPDAIYSRDEGKERR
jgi:hypothetical protein